VEARRGPELNSEFSWHEFDPTAYFEHNYRQLRADDQVILETVRDFFAKMAVPGGAERTGPPLAHGVDVGSGANLYPALTMLPFCAELTLWEPSGPNVDWLRRQVLSYPPSWDQFWARLLEAESYQQTTDPRSTLAARARVHQATLFDLPVRTWDMGTMFFVAESMTARPAEFVEATRRFVGALRPNAPFAAAFMENSIGYDVGGVRFPAVAVDRDSVRSCLEEVCASLDIHRIDCGTEPLRSGYSGMLLALGTAGPA
jgi:hypothetical protein